jgi:hypothetical protein
MKYTDKLESVMYDLSEKYGWDWNLKFETAHGCGWSAELRITRKPNDTGAANVLGKNPDVSELYFLSGLLDPEDGAKVFWEKFRVTT